MIRFIIISLLSLCCINGQSFGQNKIQYRDFDWSFIQTPHFDIYFYGGEQDLAEFTADISEEAYEQISIHLRWDLKRRVSIMVYNSHNEFQQTNVVAPYMSEGIGGVTELFKNRVVFPFEGNYEQFRHVIHHELVHAFINDMVYGGTMQNRVTSRTRIQVPLWANEGLAEFLSSNWDTKADMVLRDIAVHERMPTVNELNYFMAYKGGQSLWRFIASKYGREKIGDVFRSMKRTQNAERGFEQALGMKYNELTAQWHKYLKKEYWPDIANRDPIEDISEKLTDHKKQMNFYNISPAISPDGSMVAALSDQSGFFDIVLFDAMTGKKIKSLVKGSRSVNFEELKWLQPGISWSSDNKSIVFAAKSGKGDALHIVNVETKKSQKIEIDLDGVFSASWSPKGNEIAFVGNKGGSSDIFVYDISKKKYFQITKDKFSDSFPCWNPEGTEIVFVSDRGSQVSGELNVKMSDHDYSQTDIYTVDRASGSITRITKTDYNESYPVWGSTKNNLFYTADFEGVWNLYKLDVHEGKNGEIYPENPYPITNILTGLQQPTISRDDGRIIFAGYSGIGWDLYSIVNPQKLQKKDVSPTQYIMSKGEDTEQITDLRKQKKSAEPTELISGQYSNWIFAPGFDHMNTNQPASNEEDPIAFSDSTFEDGEYIPKIYKTRFTLDLVSGNLQISNVFGTQGMTYFAFSDILGDHQIAFGTEMVLTLENSDYYFYYAYLKNRQDYHFMAFQNADFFNINRYNYFSGYNPLARLRHYGLQFFVSNPFSRYNRIDLGFTWHNIHYSILEPQQSGYEIKYVETSSTDYSAVLPTVSYIYDNSVFGYTGPVEGFRQNTSITINPGYGKENIKFQTLKLDGRKYWRFGRNYTVAVRGYLGKSFGPNKQQFFLGGIPYWLGGRGETNGVEDIGPYRDVILDTSRASLIHDIYFTEYATPVRGARFAERFGSNVALANFEIRFPFINYLALGFPLKLILGNIRGHAFMDVGASWNDFNEFSNDSWPDRYGEYGSVNSGRFSPIITTFGLGTKVNFFGLGLLRIEAAWDKNYNGYSKPQWYFSLGPDW